MGGVILSRVQMLALIVPSHHPIPGVSLSSIIADIKRLFEGRPCLGVAHHNLIKIDTSAKNQNWIYFFMSSPDNS